MKIFIIGANGRQGSRLVKEALRNDYEVTAIVKQKLKNDYEGKVKVLNKDLFDLTSDDLKEANVVIDAFGMFDPKMLYLHQTSLKHLTDILKGTHTRLMVVGGAASLYVDADKLIRLIDSPDFPEAFKPLATSMSKAFDELQKVTDVRWTYLSPSADFDATREGTGKYKLGTDNLLVNSRGNSHVFYSDYAKAMIAEIKNQRFINARFTVVSEWE